MSWREHSTLQPAPPEPLTCSWGAEGAGCTEWMRTKHSYQPVLRTCICPQQKFSCSAGSTPCCLIYCKGGLFWQYGNKTTSSPLHTHDVNGQDQNTKNIKLSHWLKGDAAPSTVAEVPKTTLHSATLPAGPSPTQP